MPKYKLTEEQVREIRDLLDEREEIRERAAELTIQKIADRYKVDRTTITRIGNFQCWKGLL